MGPPQMCVVCSLARFSKYRKKVLANLTCSSDKCHCCLEFDIDKYAKYGLKLYCVIVVIIVVFISVAVCVSS